MFLDPSEVTLEFGFLPGEKVADFGAGSGHYSMALSRLVGPSGKVYAIDLRDEVLVRLEKIAEEAGRHNIDILVGDIDRSSQGASSGLKDSCVDGVVLSNILFQLESPELAIREAKRVTKVGGRVCVVDWKDKFPESEVHAVAKKIGLTFHRSINAGDKHYGLIFYK